MMKPWPLLGALAPGILLGFLAWGHFAREQPPAGSPILINLSATKLLSSVATSPSCRIIEDKLYDPLHPFSRAPWIARRLVAQTTVDVTEQEDFAARFQRAALNWITSCGGQIKGQQNASRNATELGSQGQQLHTLIDLPRRYYSVGDTNGVADFWCVADSGRVTLIITLCEGP